MADFENFLRSCIGSGALLVSLCAAIVVPPLVWLIVRLTSRTILSMERDRSWQAPLAGIGAILPGLSFAAVAIYGLAAAWHSNCLQYASGRVLFAILLLVTLCAAVRAAAIAHRRTKEATNLASRSYPNDRLQKGAGGVCVGEVYTDVPLCAVVGMSQPRIVVSTGALALLDDDQLRSALRHERAHISRGDHVIGPLAAFFTDLLPLPTAPLL